MKSKIFNLKRFTALLSTLIVVTLSLAPWQSTPAAAQSDGGGTTYDLPKVVPHVFQGDVRNLPQIPAKPKIEFELAHPSDAKPSLSGQAAESPNLVLAPMPAPSKNFAGMSSTDACTGGPCGAGIPPDTNGDVGLQHYIQAVNSSFAIYNKTGTLLASFTEDSLWSGSGLTPCDGNSQGDPVVVYDALADRWILTNFAFALSGGVPVAPFYQCLAVSKTSDPVSGGWFLYAVRTDTGAVGQPPVSTLNDYPKFGIWTDCLYFSANGFHMPSENFVGGEFGSFSRSDMYAGLALTASLGFRPSTNDYFTMIPSNLSAPGVSGLPPSGTPNYYVQESLTAFNFRVRKFTPGTNCGGGGTLSAPTIVSQASYTFPDGDIVPQPPPATASNKLDSLFDQMMQKVQYRKVGSAESLWVTHTFRSSPTGPTGSQWAQIKVTGGTIVAAPVQQQRFNPGDGLYRWMGSIAADKAGNVALGYSTSNGTSPHFPSIAYAGRLATDPLNTLPQSERVLVAGSGSQVNSCGGSPCHRWGDYSSMSVDPTDGCTFWYTNQYYVNQAGGNTGAWHTRIGSFRFPSCAVVTRTFASQADPDGWVLESGENSNIGGSLNGTATTFNLGDDASNRQFRTILSFDTSGLPDTAVIQSAVIRIRQSGAPTGTNPFSVLGSLLVDLRKPFFGTTSLLQLGDFRFAPTVAKVGTFNKIPASGWYSVTLTVTGRNAINKLGLTQFRLYFSLDDNNNHLANFMQFFSGNAAPANRPALIIKSIP